MSRIVRIPVVLAALKAWILRLDGELPEFKTFIPPDHFYPAMSQAISTQEDKDYPKVVVPIDSGREEDKVSRCTRETVSFDLIFVFKQIDVAPWNIPVEEQVMNFLEDFKDLRRRDYTLGGTVESVSITEWTTDSGFAYPEGFAYIKLECTWENRS